VPNAAKHSREAAKPIIGLQTAKFTAFPAVNPSIGNSSQLQLMKPFTMESAIHLPADHLHFISLARFCRAFFF
jgi:hypothetical protein